MPVFVGHFGTYAYGKIKIPIAVERSSERTMAVSVDLLIAGHIHKADDGRKEVGSLVGTIERAIAEMVELRTAFQPPVAGHAPSGVKAEIAIEKPTGTDEFVVNIVGLGVFQMAISHSEIEGIVGHQPAPTPQRSDERTVKGPLVAQTGMIVHGLCHSPVGSGRTVHGDIGTVELQTYAKRGIVIVLGKGIAVLRERSEMETDVIGVGMAVLQKHGAIAVGGKRTGETCRHLHTPTGKRVGLCGTHTKRCDRGKNQQNVSLQHGDKYT